MKHIFTLFFILSAFLIVDGQWNSDTNTNTPICTETFKQKEQRLESDGNGGAFIVWRDNRAGTGLSDIYVQRVDSNGYTLWTNSGVAVCTETSDQSAPSITTDEKDGVLIAWSDERAGQRDIYAQRIDSNGNVMWTFDGVPVATKTNREHSEKIISDDNAGAIIVWEEERADFSWDIRIQRIDSMGNQVWASNGVQVSLDNYNRINHKLQRDGDGGAFVTWQESRNGDYDIYAQHIDKDGNLLWGNNGIAVCNANNVQINPKIDPEKSQNGIFISWVDKRSNTDYDIYCNRIDSMGNLLWGATGKPVAVAIGNQSASDILSNNKTNGVIVTWKDFRNSEYDIYIQKLDLDGNPVWAENGIPVSDAANDQINPNIISDKNGGAIIAWQDARNGNWDIYSQRVRSNGTLAWDPNAEPVCTAPENQFSPKNIPDNKGGSIYVWEDKRNTFDKDIYMHHLLFEDTVTINDTTITDTTGTSLINRNAFEIASVYPNPFENDITISLNEKVRNVSIEIFDVLGKHIFREEYNDQSVVTINTGDLEISKGIYFLSISIESKKQTIILSKK